MMSFIEATSWIPITYVEAFLADRDERFREGNDKTWGAGEWIRCDRCLDSLGYPAYHHRESHT